PYPIDPNSTRPTPTPPPFPTRRSSDLFNQTTAAQYDALETLQAVLALPAIPRRIECFDISTIQGSETVASMVVCEDGRMRRAEYRKYRIRGGSALVAGGWKNPTLPGAG